MTLENVATAFHHPRFEARSVQPLDFGEHEIEHACRQRIKLCEQKAVRRDLARSAPELADFAHDFEGLGKVRLGHLGRNDRKTGPHHGENRSDYPFDKALVQLRPA